MRRATEQFRRGAASAAAQTTRDLKVRRTGGQNRPAIIDYIRLQTIRSDTLLYPIPLRSTPVTPIRIVLIHRNTLICRGKFFRRRTEHRPLDPSEIRALDFNTHSPAGSGGHRNTTHYCLPPSRAARQLDRTSDFFLRNVPGFREASN